MTPDFQNHMLLRQLTQHNIAWEQGYPLADCTTHNLGGPAALAVLPLNPQELAIAIRAFAGAPHMVLGGGSNMLIADAGCTTPVVSLGRMSHLSLSGSTITVDAGVASSAVADFALENGLTGAEFLTWLPGSIGGAAFMNARAFGTEMSCILTHALAVSSTGELLNLTCTPEQFSYKNSPFREQHLIVARVSLTLTPADPGTISATMAANREHRRRNGEDLYPSCGCVFKNPLAYGTSAGKIIDDLGLKGFGTPNVWVHKKHANFIVHNGSATATEVRTVMEQVRARVREKLDLELEFEVEFEGDWTSQ